MTDRQTDKQTEGRPGKNNMSPDPEGGDISKEMGKIMNRYNQVPQLQSPKFRTTNESSP